MSRRYPQMSSWTRKRIFRLFVQGFRIKKIASMVGYSYTWVCPTIVKELCKQGIKGGIIGARKIYKIGWPNVNI